jgi:CDGSH-type Zn-finger protein/uncharacterized Fe-S cluster protein YjdI
MSSQTDITINDREELIYLLTEAAEFEHTVMCTYLYAMWSLKQDESEGITGEEKEAIGRWRNSIRSVAMEEMLHLTLVNNLMAAIGAAPHFSRPEFPVGRGNFPDNVNFHLVPFNEQSIEHFVFIERPEGIKMEDGAGFGCKSHYERIVCPDLLTPTPCDYQSQGHLYHSIAQSIQALATELGEERLFVGHGEAQLGSSEYPLLGLFKVTDVASAMKAIEEIVLQGEGAPVHREDSHYARFAAIRDEYRKLKSSRPGFVPAHPSAINPVLTEFSNDDAVVRITDLHARRIVDLGNSLYGLMLHTTAQVCAPVPLPGGLRQDLSEVSTELMGLVNVLGEAAARTPLGMEHPGVNAGLSFALPRSFGQLVQANAARILGERAAELAGACRAVEKDIAINGVAGSLDHLATRLAGLHEKYEEHFTLRTAEPASQALQRSVDSFSAKSVSQSAEAASSKDITIHFDTSRCIHSQQCVLNAPKVFRSNVEGPWLHPEEDTVEHLVHTAQLCPSGAITYTRLDGGADECAPQVNMMQTRENGPYAFRAALDIEGQGSLYRATLCRCGKSNNKPFCDNTHREIGFVATGEPQTLPFELLESRSGVLQVTPVMNGPLHVRGPIEICSGTGRTVTCTQNVKLCRCGASANKPFCDGSHVRIKFRSE